MTMGRQGGRRRWRKGSGRRCVAGGLLLILIAACSPVETKVGLDGTLTVLEPRHDFSIQRLPEEWLIIGGPANPAPAVQSANNQLHLTLKPVPESYAMIKRVQARLLATPFLGWHWMLSGPAPIKHPVQITVGFADDGDPKRRIYLRNPLQARPPTYSRTLTFTWGNSALRRGMLEVRSTPPGNPPVAVYTVRGGRENLRRWWREAVDLSALHAKAWPKVDMRASRIVFVGIIVGTGAPEAMANIAALRLSR